MVEESIEADEEVKIVKIQAAVAVTLEVGTAEEDEGSDVAVADKMLIVEAEEAAVMLVSEAANVVEEEGIGSKVTTENAPTLKTISMTTTCIHHGPQRRSKTWEFQVLAERRRLLVTMDRLKSSPFQLQRLRHRVKNCILLGLPKKSSQEFKPSRAKKLCLETTIELE